MEFFLGAFVLAVFLLIGMKVCGFFAHTIFDVPFGQLLIIVLATTVIGLVPDLGWALSTIVFFLLMKKFARTNIFETLLIVLTAKFISHMALLYLMTLLLIGE
ncbi:MAG: hypothetical protein ABIG64_09670 [Candidatus Omnitrophota bacterium]